MKKISIFAAALLLSASSFAQTWNLDKAHARLGFTITHMMVSDVDGSFKNFDATVTAAKPDFSDAKVQMTAQTASIYTDNDMRDEHLRKPDYFDAEKYPTVTFQSTSLKKVSEGKYKMTGNLTMHGVTIHFYFSKYQGSKEYYHRLYSFIDHFPCESISAK